MNYNKATKKYNFNTDNKLYKFDNTPTFLILRNLCTRITNYSDTNRNYINGERDNGFTNAFIY